MWLFVSHLARPLQCINVRCLFSIDGGAVTTKARARNCMLAQQNCFDLGLIPRAVTSLQVRTLSHWRQRFGVGSGTSTGFSMIWRSEEPSSPEKSPDGIGPVSVTLVLHHCIKAWVMRVSTSRHCMILSRSMPVLVETSSGPYVCGPGRYRQKHLNAFSQRSFGVVALGI